MLCRKCPPLTSSYTGEALAILEAVSYILSHDMDQSIICSDSQSCLNSLCSNLFRAKIKHPIILKIKELLFECHERNIRVTLTWIPSHCGILGNESADWCAKSASRIASESHNLVYSQDLISLAQLRLTESWKASWKTSQLMKGKFYASIQGDIPSKPWFSKFKKVSKPVTSVICRIRLGHSCTPVHLAKIRVRDSSLCECGIDEGTLDHIFLNCPNLSPSLYDFLPPDIPRPTNMNTLLAMLNTPIIEILTNFITTNKLKL
ncbi:uncharacterized protein LOC123695755 [Colias croceus]|uniref:uncharacterized protein LOC123695745 n=1 Tax=Colias crocea TaxID=72248 RepID=UPI001E27EE10|nr:uncharacterized protein LOC123695745 [Colias croceus]XP_045497635.1 uncharacterized protein LOC123695755 [Colias croceus]